MTNKRGRPTQAKAADLDREIREAAVATFLESGYDGASMEAIARAAGITKRTLYNRYADKRAAFLDAIPWALSRTVDETAPIIDGTDLRAALVAIARGALARALDPDTVRLHYVARNEASRFPEFAISAHTLGWSGRQQQVMDLLRRHEAAGAVKVGDPELAAGGFLSLIEMIPTRLAEFGVYRTKEEEDRHVNYAVDLFIRGISVR